MKIDIKENINRPAWTSRSFTGQGRGTVRLPGNTLGLDDTLKLIEREEEVKKNEHDEIVA